MPDCGPLGEIFFEAGTLAIVDAFLVNKPLGGCVESVLTFATHRLLYCAACEFSIRISTLIQSPQDAGRNVDASSTQARAVLRVSDDTKGLANSIP
jgi:hypothetical protein